MHFEKKNLTLGIALLLSLLFIYPSASAFAQTVVTDSTQLNLENPLLNYPKKYVIKDITVVGSKEFTADFIPTTAGLAIGEQISIPGDDIPQAIKRLFRTGIFSDVKILENGKDNTSISLKIILTEKPRLNKFYLEGVKKSQRNDIKDMLTIIRGTAITETFKAQTINTIKRYYRGRGNIDIKVKTRVEMADTSANRADVYFEIDPGYRPELKDIIVEGNDDFSEKTIRKNLKPLKEDAWFRIFGKKLLKEEDLEEAKEKLKAFYHKKGYRDFRIISDSSWAFNLKDDGSKKGMKLKLDIYEGPQYKVRNITWTGNKRYTDEILTASLGFEKGEVFDMSKYEANTQINEKNTDITSLYQNDGYLFFRLIDEIDVVGQDSVDLNFVIYEDDKAKIKRVDFTGNTTTFDNVVRRTLRTVPGQYFSRQDIIRTIRELGTIGYFNPESITPDVIPNPYDKTVDVTYNLDESQSVNNFEFSGGYGGSLIGLILSARLNFNNFSIDNAFSKDGWKHGLPMGDGQKLSLGVQVTGRGYQSYSIGFQEPWFKGRPTSVGVNMGYSFVDYRNSDQEYESFYTAVTVGKRLTWPDDFFTFRNTISFSANRYNLSYQPKSNNKYISLTTELERNSMDNYISPNMGSKFLLSLQLAPPVLDISQFYKFKTEYQNHINIFDKFVFSHGFEGGLLGFLGKKNRIQVFERFSMGGTPLQQRQQFYNDNITLRGFPGGTGGTIQPYVNGQDIGGRVFTKYFAELRYPAVASEQVNLVPYTFFDSGNVYQTVADFDPFNVKRAAGFGVRIFMPILGLVDLSYGYRFDGVPGTDIEPGQWEFLFNLGAPF